MAALWLQEFQRQSDQAPQPYPGEEAEQQPGSKRPPPGPLAGLLLMDEHLPVLAAERQEAPGEEAAAHPGIEELLCQLRQKDSDLILAAKLGKALLERNQELSNQFEMMQRELTDKLEHLEQEKHELRRRFENREGEWEGRVAELESDLKQLQDELERHQVQLREANKEKVRALRELSEQNQRLLEQLTRAAEIEQQLSMQVHNLRDEFQEKSTSTNQHVARLESLQAEILEIKALTERKRELEQRISAMIEENELLQSTIEDLQDRVMMAERQSHNKDLQLQQNQLELHEVRMSHRQLQVKVDEMNEEMSLHSVSPTSTSLLSEIEQSMEAEELEQEREQLRIELWEAYCQVRSLCSHLRGNDITDSALSTDSSMDESSDTSSAKDIPTGSLHTALHELKRLIQNILDGNESTVVLLRVEMNAMKEERDKLKVTSEEKELDKQLQKAVSARDEAIAKKNAVEMELAKCKIDMMSLNSQLLDAIQQKLNLSQQLEAWQDDMHRVIDQQLMDKQQRECYPPAQSYRNSCSMRHKVISSVRLERNRQEVVGAEGKSPFSFFKKN
ncbi:BICD family-like cargo adapter 1 isoform X2 [Chiloscyllium plagiosum]|uniref:BICD family-like cargo adapter 1 isoform X2 n=1 Tax=Chiloscyllium plagiosum TaxID=36176 RepID=UPI001CB8376E|nr:BICD family-like cargo adapter 1 isoform X2 [Chiloscyllium plagiosum]